MRSLRGRLTLGVAAVLAAVLLVGGVSVSRYVEQAELETIDDRLQRTADLSRATLVETVDRELPVDDRRLDRVLRASGTSLRLFLGDRELDRTGRPPSRPIAATDGLRTLTAGGSRYRVLTVSLDADQLGGLGRAEVTTRLERTERRQRELDRTLLGFGGLALLVAAAGTWFAADLLLRPLRRLRRLTGSITGDDLGLRIPTDDGAAELRALATSFDAMLTRLARSSADRERALEATRRFAADAGHELRTPLTSVQANLSALRRHPDLPAARRAELLDDALAEQQRLVALLDGLQALARGDAAPLMHARVDLAAVVDLALEAARSRHPATSWRIELPDDEVAVDGWEPGLRLIADNLVENAARHGRPGGTVRVTLSDGPGPELVVEDDGGGIPEAERDRILQPFARVSGTTAPGSGLGLALVAQQVGHHGATLKVEDASLGGARFRVRFAAG